MRARLSRADIWPLVSFLVFYALLISALQWTNAVYFAAPRAFGLMVFAPWLWWLHVAGYSGLRGWRGHWAFFARMFLLGLLVAVIAEPRSVQSNRQLSVVFAVDVSRSIAASVQSRMAGFIQELAKDRPSRDEAGLIVFARDAAVEQPPGTDFYFDMFRASVDRDGTHIEKGLSLAAAMIRDDVQGRIVLLTDGVSTEGAPSSALDDLRSRGIAVDVLPIEYDYAHEVWIERLQLPKTVKVGETYEAVVILSSLTSGEGKLILQENDVVQFEQPVTFEAGKNRFAIPIPLRHAGFYEYTATIEVPPDRDGVRENNQAVSYLHLEGEGRVLVVTHPGGNVLDSQALIRAMRQSERAVEVMTAYELPRDPMALLSYDCIIFVNVPADMFDAMQLRAVHDAVRHQGSGFVMVGGEHSFGPGGYHQTAIEELLPVSMDITARKVLPRGALVFVLDRSGSMQSAVGGSQMTQQQIASEAAVLSLQKLFPQDYVGAIAFDTRAEWIVRLQVNADPDGVARRIRSITPGGGTNIYTGLAEAVQALAGMEQREVSTKHIILLTDGQSTAGPYDQAVATMVRHGITLTTVGIGDAPDGQLLQTLARATGGQYHAVADPRSLVSVFIREVLTLRRSMVQEGDFVPDIRMPSQILKDIDAMPQLGGYVITTLKGPPAAGILIVPETEDDDPVLARWNYGIGRAAAFTSDLSPRWAAQWIHWPQYAAFVQQLITDIARLRQVSHLRMETFASGTQGVVVVEDYAEASRFLDVAAVVEGPGGRQETLALEQVGPRRYEGRFATWGVGRYQIMAGTHGDQEPDAPAHGERVHGGFALSYSQELARFRSDPITIEQIVSATDGRLLTPEMTGRELYDVPRTVRRSTQPLTDQWWLWLLLSLLVLHDVAVRRVQLDWALLRGWFGTRTAGSPDQTVDALLRRKRTVAQQVAQEDDALGAGSIDPTRTAPSPSPRPQPRMVEPATSPAPETISTTERLLKLKRRRDEQE